MININKALFVVAHPDDETLGCGGIIKKLTSLKKETFILLVAEGSSCRFGPKEIGSKKVKIEIEKRRKNAIKAFNILGVKDYLFNNFKCGQLNTYPLLEINQVIEKVMDKFKPDAVFTHHHNDVNQDHNVVYKSVSIASRPVKSSTITKVFSFETLSSTEWNFKNSFRPNYYCRIDKEINHKIKAFEKYSSTEGGKFPFPRSSKAIKNLSMYRGSQVGFNHAEAFELIRAIER